MNLFKQPGFLFSAAFAAVAGVALAYQDAARIPKAWSQSVALAAILVSVYYNQREIYAAEKKLDPEKKVVDLLPKLSKGVWFSGISMAAMYALTRGAVR